MKSHSRIIRAIRKVLFIFNIDICRRYPVDYQRAGVSQLKGDLIGVEIGVDEGWGALSLLKNFNIKMLYLIDPYIDCEGFSQRELDNAFKSAKRRLRKYKDKITWIIKTSDEALKEIPNELDFVNIDSLKVNRTRDTESYYPKVKKGGLLAGGDHIAVMDFIKNKNVKFCSSANSWWFFKK